MSMERFDFNTPNQALIRMFEQAQVDVMAILEDLPTSASNFIRLSTIEAQITGVLSTLSADSSVWAGSVLPSIYQRAINETLRDVAALGITTFVSPLESQFAFLNIATIQALSASANQDLQNSISSAGTNLFRSLRATNQTLATDAALSQALGISATLGESPKKQKARIIATLFPDGKPLITTVNGRNFDSDFYANLVAITRTREAATQGVVATMAVNGNDLVLVSTHPHKKDICTPFDGKVFSISGNSTEFPPLKSIPNSGPPFHPRCKHVTLPFIEDLASPSELKTVGGIESKFLNVKKTSNLDKIVQDDAQLKTVTRGFNPSI